MIGALPLLFSGLVLAQDGGPVAPAANANFVAVVVGLSSYDNLPDEVELDFARSDAAIVHRALKENASFTHTFLLTDGEATREGIRELLRTEVAQLLGPDDTFVFYFVGHGVGADLDLPTFLAYDSTLENGQEDGLELTGLATDLTTWGKAGTTLIVTDAIHRNQLDGIYFFGPAASQWPSMPKNTVILSSSQPDSPAADGAFGTVFADAVSGAADADSDAMVTASELVRYLTDRMMPAGQIPVASGDYSEHAVISHEVKGATVDASAPPEAPVPEAEPKYPDTVVWSAKFVFREGASQSVQCRDTAVKACSPSCYIRQFKAGVCQLKAIIDGTEMVGQVPVLFAGKYDCGRKAGDLICKPPFEAATQPD